MINAFIDNIGSSSVSYTGESSRRFRLLKEVVARYPANRYEIAKSAEMPASTAYYESARLEKDGYIKIDEDGVVHPSLKGLVRYVAEFGCDRSVILAARRRYGFDPGPGFCRLLEMLAPYESSLGDELLETLFKLVEGPRGLLNLARDKELADTIARIIAHRFPAITLAGHRGILIADGDVWFIGYCKLCARYVVDRCKLFEEAFNYKNLSNKA